ncbi:MAG: FAD-dependent monooxygenase [Parachlamydiales bacterium]|nr:FAD-dependent monooxygenase [Parachlamydiales bacterium]
MSHLLFSSISASENCIKVLIVGAGPCGLAVAKALQNNNIYPDIIEKDENIRSDGAGIAIPANGTWALDKLGIDISSKSYLIHSMQFTDDQGEILAQEKIDDIHPEGAQFYSLTRDKLVEQLLSHLDKRIQIQTSTTIKHFAEENDLVRVEFSNGDIKYYDLVVGCDGVHSCIRRQVQPNELPEYLGLLVWRTVIDSLDGVSMPTYMLGSDRLVMLYPMLNNQIYVYGHIFQSEKSLPSESFSKLFLSFGGLVPKTMHAIDQQNLNFYIHHMEKSHSVRFKLDGFSRVLLVGDAAHAFGPMLQNGAAQAFEDAYVIQDLLKEQMDSHSVISFVNTFEKRRFARVQNIFTMSNAKIQAISDPQLIQGRNEAIKKSGAPNVIGFKLIMQQNP